MKHYSRTRLSQLLTQTLLILQTFWDLFNSEIYQQKTFMPGKIQKVVAILFLDTRITHGVLHGQRKILFKDMIAIYLNQISECRKLEPSPAKIKCKSSSRIDSSILNKYLKFRIQMFQTNILSFYQKNDITCITQTSFSAHLYIIVPFQIKQQ